MNDVLNDLQDQHGELGSLDTAELQPELKKANSEGLSLLKKLKSNSTVTMSKDGTISVIEEEKEKQHDLNYFENKRIPSKSMGMETK